MINIIKNNKIKVLIFGIVMLLAFLFTITMPKAYTIDSEGNLVSQNLFDINELNTTDYTIDIVNKNSFDMWSVDTNNILKNNIEFEENTQYTISYILTNNTANGRLRIYLTNGDFFDMVHQSGTTAYEEYTNPVNTTIASIGATWGNGVPETRITNLMVNKGTTAIPYEPYGIWYSQENLEIINPWIDNIESVTYETQNIIDLNSETAVYYVSPDNIAFNLLLHANGITSSSDYQYARYIEINFKRPVNMSNYKYTISFNNNGPTGEQPTFVGFGVTNGPNYIYNFEYEAVDYQFQIPSNTYVDSIELKWYSTNDKPCWPEGMTLDDFYLGWSHGVQQGTREGYNNGYNEGYNNGLQSGETIGYNNGYAQGLKEGSTQGNTLYGMIIRSC